MESKALADTNLPSQSLELAVEEQARQREILIRFAQTQLKKEHGDYNEIKGRKSLGKPGAEKFCALFGVTISEPELAQDIMDALPEAQRTAGVIVFRVRLLRHGEYLGSGVGGRSLKQDMGDVNKSLKMAKKSAIIDAVISTFGLSDLFTQDMGPEDGVSEEEPIKKQEVPMTPPRPNPELGLSPKQPETLMATDEQKEDIRAYYGPRLSMFEASKGKVDDLTYRQAEAIIQKLVEHVKEKEVEPMEDQAEPPVAWDRITGSDSE